MLQVVLAAALCVAPDPLTVYCAAGVRAPVEAAAEAWTKETGQRVQLQFGGSGTLLNNLRVAPRADLYLAAATGYMDKASALQLIAEQIPLAHQHLCIAVPAGNPAGITSIDDVLDGKVRLAIPNPDTAAAGKTCKTVLQELGVWDRLQPSIVVTKPTVNEVAADVRLGTVDAAITWNATTRLVGGLEAVNDARFKPSREAVTIGVLRASKQPTNALQFARWLAARDRGALDFARAGFEPVRGDVWALHPRLVLFAGAMLRPAIEPVIEAFCAREGVTIDRVYNGCGVLVAQMRTGALPDAYAACDQQFLDVVQEHFVPGTLLSRNEMVLIVPKGNPAGLTGAADMLKPGLRLGVASPERSALGALTVQALTAADLWAPLQRSGNIKVESATGDFLVNQVRAGGLDGAIVYHSNARASKAVRDGADVVPLGLDVNPATQPWTVRLDGDHALTLGRLHEAIKAARQRGAFEALGFLPPTDTAP